MNRKNKTALATGGRRGLGRNMATNLAKKGIDDARWINGQRIEVSGGVML